MRELAYRRLMLSGNRVVPRSPLSGPGDPAAGGFRTALAALFPVAPSVPGGPGGLLRERPVRVGIEILAVLVAAVAMLLRVAPLPSWDVVYAEDNGVFLVGALAHPWDLLAQFGGYLELVPRVLGQIVSLLPLWDAARVYAVSGALIAAVCALFTYHASEGYIRSPWLRGMLGAALILLPLAPIEMADSGVDSPWYLLPTAFWAVMWRPRTRSGMLAAALMAAVRRAVVASSSLALRRLLPAGRFLVIRQAPHDWLFPRVQAVVHHGGAGTTGAAVAAGRPQVIWPFGVDQHFWARRMTGLGVAPSARPVRALTGPALAAALDQALGDRRLAAAAAELGQRVRAEDGCGTAVAQLEALRNVSPDERRLVADPRLAVHA